MAKNSIPILKIILAELSFLMLMAFISMYVIKIIGVKNTVYGRWPSFLEYIFITIFCILGVVVQQYIVKNFGFEFKEAASMAASLVIPLAVFFALKRRLTR